MFEIVGQINHLAAGEVEINAADRARSGSHLRNRFSRHIDPEQMVFAFDTGLKIERVAVRRPLQAAGNQIETISGED